MKKLISICLIIGFVLIGSATANEENKPIPLYNYYNSCMKSCWQKYRSCLEWLGEYPDNNCSEELNICQNICKYSN